MMGCVLGFVACFGAGPARAEAPVVFAAASLRGALDAVAEAYGGAVLSYGGSGSMARQVAQGAPADVVILASDEWMEWLVAQGAVPEAQVLLGNSLVLIGPAGAEAMAEISAETILARLGGGRLAMGHAQSVPAGIYARDWLEGAGLWEALSPHLAETENVRVALAFVARGEAPLGIVYGTDALADPGVQVLYEVPEERHAQIVYPAAALTPKGNSFLTFLEGSEAKEIFEAYGFRPMAEDP
ncbi:molybdate ABC transporter substrate-binding protein [Roseovarius sp. LXJ103]|uniref:molybdate ABC transporter substrate-binding protein n=1 Tax=Roseovarius carneus TaxID=2853164 RepID=UPI000D6191CE|nr:molybdate ABC transporter substrate-binding protein [Roseovarius carneus]MBZ8118755.1 molybdate ABC transporter substrate-binding protein [Roseovarius carneus]PWE35571.1 molybdate ABC transporter substrate-binding protein [Pelagicola sp. LXJ1103]